MPLHERFRRFAHAIADAMGTAWSFLVAVAIIVTWAVTGPLFGYSDTWQLVINTGTTIVTFLMVFLIQNAQNRDAKAIHLKLDELLRASKGARTSLVNLEALSDDELSRLQGEFERIQHKLEGSDPSALHAVKSAVDDELEERGSKSKAKKRRSKSHAERRSESRH